MFGYSEIAAETVPVCSKPIFNYVTGVQTNGERALQVGYTVRLPGHHILFLSQAQMTLQWIPTVLPGTLNLSGSCNDSKKFFPVVQKICSTVSAYACTKYIKICTLCPVAELVFGWGNICCQPQVEGPKIAQLVAHEHTNWTKCSLNQILLS